jgi:hypothetical protein
MKKNSKPRKKLTSFQVDKEALDSLKSVCKKDESYSVAIKRLVSNQIEIDEGLKKELEKLSQSTGIEKKTLISFGATIVIFLASSGALQELQKMAILKKKPLTIVFLGLLKKFFKV